MFEIYEVVEGPDGTLVVRAIPVKETKKTIIVQRGFLRGYTRIAKDDAAMMRRVCRTPEEAVTSYFIDKAKAIEQAETHIRHAREDIARARTLQEKMASSQHQTIT